MIEMGGGFKTCGFRVLEIASMRVVMFEDNYIEACQQNPTP